jgi:hypothetical protein
VCAPVSGTAALTLFTGHGQGDHCTAAQMLLRLDSGCNETHKPLLGFFFVAVIIHFQTTPVQRDAPTSREQHASLSSEALCEHSAATHGDAPEVAVSRCRHDVAASAEHDDSPAAGVSDDELVE